MRFYELEQVKALRQSWRNQGRRVVFTNGCFRCLHAGHEATLKAAAKLGDCLIVAVNSADTVRQLKGDAPLLSDYARVAFLSALPYVSAVLLQRELTPCSLLREIKPDILAKGGTTPEIVGREIVEEYGGQVVGLGTVPDCSASWGIESGVTLRIDGVEVPHTEPGYDYTLSFVNGEQWKPVLYARGKREIRPWSVRIKHDEPRDVHGRSG